MSDWDVQEAAASIFPESAWVDGAVDGLREHFGKGLNIHVFLGKKGKGYEYYLHSELFALGHYLLNKFKDKSVRKDIELKWADYKKEMNLLFNQIRQSEPSKLNITELKEFHRRLNDLYTNYYKLMIFAEPIEPVIDEFFKKFLQSDVKNIKVEFSKLVTPPCLSFVQMEKLSILNFLSVIGSNKRKSIFSGDFKEILSEIKKNDTLSKLFEKHREDFGWLRSSYLDASKISEEDVIERAKEMALHSDISKEIKSIKNFESEIKKTKKEIISKFELSSELKEMVEISDFVGKLHDERKEYTLKSLYYMQIVLEEIGKRYNYTLHDMKFSKKEDIIALFKTGKLDKNKIKDGFEAYAYEKTPGQYKEYYGREALEYEKKFMSKSDFDVSVIHGMGVSEGKASGKVKIIHLANSKTEFNTGDILVAPMTRPEYVPLMSKASAVITDQGGITSHAAIVAREMKKPCIVGTKNATKILKDGDVVEVNATHGIVRITERAK